MRSITRFLVLIVVSVPSASLAQSAKFTGVVTRDTLGHPVARAEIELPALGRMTHSNDDGEFQFLEVPSGRYDVIVRAIGFEVFAATISLNPGQTLDGDLTLVLAPIALDTVRTTALNRSSGNSIEYREFEERQKEGFGHFIDSVQVRKHGDGHNFPDFLASHFADLSVTSKAQVGQPTYLSAGRSLCSGPAFSCGAPTACLVTLYVDGIPVYVPGQTPGLPPDLDDYRADDFAAAEWYPGGGSIPAQYNITGAGCGVLLLWRRR